MHKSYFLFLITISLVLTFTIMVNAQLASDLPVVIHIPGEGSGGGFDEIFSDVRYLALETTEESHVKKIHKIMVTDSVIVVWDRSVNTVFLFDGKGKFVSKINHVDGSGNLIEIWDVNIDNDRVILLDAENQSLISYNAKGKYLKSSKIDDFLLSGSSFTSFGRHLLFNRGYYPLDGSYLGVFNSESLKFEKSLVPFKFTSLKGGIQVFDGFQKEGSSLLFMPPLTNEIFEIDSSLNSKKRYELVFKMNNPDFTDIDSQKFNSIMDFDDFIEKKGYLLSTSNFQLFGKYIYFQFLTTFAQGLLTRQHVFYNKETRKVNLGGNREDLVNGKFWSDMKGCNGEELLGVISNPRDLINVNNILKIPEGKIPSNPVLAFYRMNDKSFE